MSLPLMRALSSCLNRTVWTGAWQEVAAFVMTLRENLNVRLRNLWLSDGKPSPERRAALRPSTGSRRGSGVSRR
jgi:hypothetical protein